MTQAERIYNHRVSRERHVMENAFGIFASRLYEKLISLKLETLDKVVLACCAIHNWLKKTNPQYVNGDLIDYEDEDLTGLTSDHGVSIMGYYVDYRIY